MTISAGTGTTSITVNIASTFTSGAVKVSAVNACGSIPGTELLVYGKVPPSIITGPLNVCGMTTATYSCNTVVNANSYVWTVPTTWSIASGQGTTSITANLPVNVNNATFSGVVKVHSVNVCGNSADKAVTVSFCKSAVSMNNGAGEENGISDLYPNPTSSEFSFDIIADADKNITVEVYDLLGKKVIQQKYFVIAGQSSFKINIEQFKDGMYFIRLLDKDNSVLNTQRVIKQ